jgi:CRP-like cAMP-binding protein
VARDDAVLDLLRKVEIFADVRPKQLRLIRSMGKEVFFEPGDTLTREGEKGGRLFLILEGEAKVYFGARTRARTTLGAGDVVGEMSLLDGEPRTASVIAATDVHTWSLTSFNFRPILRENPKMMEHLLLILCRRLRTTERSMVD